ncbi:MAG: NDUFA4 family protein [Thermoanaerobaculia bacterium]|nr:NDUFA4 family protein [Thermoanaerobaculia bacterium]
MPAGPLVAYYMGVFSIAALIPFLGIVGIGMGIVAFFQGVKGRRLALDHPEVKGKVHAWVGILLGGLWTLLGLAIHALILVALVAG